MKNKKTYFGTFSKIQQHPDTGNTLKNNWITVIAEDLNHADKLMYERFGNNWSMILTSDNFDIERFPGGPLEEVLS